MEADLLRYYQLDLADVGAPGLSWRRLGAIVASFPRDSASRRGVVGEANDWGRVEYLLADLIDAVQAWGWAGVGNRKNPQPRPIRRPGDHSNRTDLSPREIHARLLELRRRHRRR